MAGNQPEREAAFKVRAVCFPSTSWYEFRKAFKPKPSNRVMRDAGGPPWERIDGRGFTLWISEGCLADSTTTPPTWEIRLQALTTLNQAGRQRFQEVCEGIIRFIELAGLECVADSNA